MIKKAFISLVLVFVVLAATVYASDVVETSTGLDFMSEFGIINLETDPPTENVTRELFALYYARIMRFDETNDDNTRYYVDVENDIFSHNAINFLVKNGVVSVPEDKLFRPSDNITYEEAIKILVSALGYDKYAMASGGFPTGYLTVAKKLDLDIKVKDSSCLTVKEAADLLYKAIFTPTYKISSISEESVSWKQGETLFEINWNIHEAEGTVKAFEGMSIEKGEEVSKNHIVIGDTVYGCDKYFGDFLGCYVKYYYEEIPASDTVVYMVSCGKNEDIKINIKDIKAISENSVTYYEDNRTKSKNIIPSYIVYNGSYLTQNVSETLNNLYKGYVTLRDSNDDGKYDIIIINDYRNFIVSGINTYDDGIYNLLSVKDSICFRDYGSYSIFDEKGNVLDFSEIVKDDLFAVYEAKDNKYIRLERCNKKIVGTIDGISNTDDIVFNVNNIDYIVDNDYYSKHINELKIGNTFTFVLDPSDAIIYSYQGEVDKSNIVLLMNAIYDSDLDVVHFKFLNSSGVIEKYDAYKNIKIDGSKCAMTNVCTYLTNVMGLDTNGNINKEVVVIEMTSDKLVKSIDTPYLNTKYESAENSLTKVYDDESVSRLYTFAGAKATSTRNFGRTAIMDSNTLTFYGPYDKNDVVDEDYIVKTHASTMVRNVAYYGNAYRLNANKPRVDVVFCKYQMSYLSGNYSDTKEIIAVDKINEACNADGDVVWHVIGFSNALPVEVEVPHEVDFSGIKRGDLINLNFDINKKAISSYSSDVDDYTVFYRISDGVPSWTINPATGCKLRLSTNYKGLNQMSFGNLVKFSDTIAMISAEGYEKINDMFDVTGLGIVVYDSKNNELRKGTVEDLLTYESCGKDCSKIIYNTNSYTGKWIYVIN